MRLYVIIGEKVRLAGLCVLGLAIFLSGWSSDALADGKIVVAALANGGDVYDMAVRSIKESLAAGENPPEVSMMVFNKEALTDSVRLSADLKALSASVIVAVGTGVAKAVQKSTSGIPVVFMMVLGPDRSGVVPPGVSMDIPYLVKLKESGAMFPDKKRVGVIYSSAAESEITKIQAACTQASCSVVALKIESEKDFPLAVERAIKESDILLMIADPQVYFPKAVEYLLGEALKNGLPVIGLSAAYVKAGALVSFDCDYADIGRQTAQMTMDVLSGQQPSQVVAPQKAAYSFNIQVAQRIGVTISEEWLKKADKVFGK